jgi:hypothetical protein
MKIQTGLIKVAAIVALFVLLAVSSLASSTQRAGALQATQAATMPAVPTAAALPPNMAKALVPCAAGVTGPCDLIATKAEDIAGVWKQYFNNPRFNAPGGVAYIRYNADGTYILADSIENTAKPFKNYPTGTFKFEGDQFIFSPAADAPAPCDIPPHYQLRVLKYGDKPVALRYVAISETCPARLQDLNQALVWVAPNTQ